MPTHGLHSTGMNTHSPRNGNCGMRTRLRPSRKKDISPLSTLFRRMNGLVHTFANTYQQDGPWNRGEVGWKSLVDIGYYQASDGNWKWINGEMGVEIHRKFDHGGTMGIPFGQRELTSNMLKVITSPAPGTMLLIYQMMWVTVMNQPSVSSNDPRPNHRPCFF